MQVISSVSGMQREADRLRASGARIGFVPTMGFLHEGHLDLVRHCRERADAVVMSIFVNPTQFGAGEDFNRYPRDLERDARLAEESGCDILFTPEAAEVYAPDASTWVQVDGLSSVRAGGVRPPQLRGGPTIVTKLLNMVKPHCAVFGQKDAQQALILRRMARDLHMDVELVIAPTRREADGLAMSSRNTYLSDSGRIEALAISRSLRLAERYVADGGCDAEVIRGVVNNELTRSGAVIPDYVALVDAETLESVAQITHRPALLAIAARVEKTRLIDNTILRAETIES